MIWLKMETINVGTAIDLSGLGLDTIENEEGFSIGAMVTLRQLEDCTTGLAAYTRGAVKEAAAAYRGRAASQSGDRRRQPVQPVRLFRCADHVYGHGLFGRELVQRVGSYPLQGMLSAPPYDRDILVRLIVKKEKSRIFLSVRAQQPD